MPVYRVIEASSLAKGFWFAPKQDETKDVYILTVEIWSLDSVNMFISSVKV